MNQYVIAMYIRLSLEDAKTDSLSIANQRLLLRRHIATLEQENVKIMEFVDNGYSGVNFERPAMQELLELVRQSKIHCIIVKDFSRFGRNMIETGYFLEKVFPLYRTRFLSVSDGFDTKDYKEDTGGMAVAFKYLMHEYYSVDLSRKTKSAKYAKMKSGEYQSKVCCYGYRKGPDGRLAIDEEAATVVRRIFALAQEAKHAGDIVKVLYADKIPTPGEYRASKGNGFHDISRCAGIWQRSTVLRILTDERYIGTYVIGKRTLREIGGTRSRLKDESEWYKIPNHHSAIVGKEVYDQVQTKLRHFKCDKKPRSYPLRGKVICGSCGHAMQRAPRKEPVFVCRYTKVDASAPCHRLEVKEKDLEKLLFEMISKQAQILLNAEHLHEINELGLQSEQQSEYKRQIDLCQYEKQHLYEQLILKEISMEQHNARKAELDAELSRLNSAYSILSAKTAQLQAERDSANKAAVVAEDVQRADRLTQMLVDSLIDKIYVYPDRQIEIVWKVADFLNPE